MHRKTGLALCAAGVVWLAGCGYVGPIVPPSPMIPVAVTDLTVQEVGDRLVVAFTPPTRTTDEFAISSFSSWQVRVVPAAPADGKDYEIPVKPGTVEYSFPASDWIGQNVSVSVRTAVKTNNKFSAWSNAVKLNVVSPLKAPVVTQEATADGYKLTWQDEGANVHYDVLRKGPADQKYIELGTADQPQYVDGTALWSTPYTYEVIARVDNAQSPVSEPIAVNHEDTFPPRTPTGLLSSSTGDAIELSWDRNTESDLKGYYVYRSNDGQKFDKVGDLLTLPTYSDHAVEHGHSYVYRVSAIDQTALESPPSETLSVAFP